MRKHNLTLHMPPQDIPGGTLLHKKNVCKERGERKSTLCVKHDYVSRRRNVFPLISGERLR